MTQQKESIERRINGLARRVTLLSAVRHAVPPSQVWIRAGIIAAGLAAGIPGAGAAPFPPVFPLANLIPPGGGDGSEGFVLRGIGESDLSGNSVSGAGDVNGDGVDDVLIGAPAAMPGGLHWAGESYLVFGSTQGFAPAFPLATLYPAGGGDGSRGVVFPGFEEDAFVGDSVSAAGDVNGDGIGDLVIGASDAQGGAYVVFGSTQAFPAVLPLAALYPAGGGDGTRGFVLYGRPFDLAGRSVSAAGDVNGDGIDDLILAGGGHGFGGAFVVFGRNTAQIGNFPAVFPLPDLLLDHGGDGSEGFALIGLPSDGAGSTVSAAGDVNGDGVDDVIIRAGGLGNAGGSYVVFGTTEGFPAEFVLASLLPSGGGDGSRGFVLEGIDEGDVTGGAARGAGDVNGDGIDDLIIGALSADPGGKSGAGEAYVVFGSTQPFPPVFPLATLYPAGGGDGSSGFVLTGTGENDQAGSSVSPAGDVNADGIDDLVIAALMADRDNRSMVGEAYVVFGSTQPFPAVLPLLTLEPGAGGDGSVGFVLPGINGGDRAGSSVDGAGDVNGDGIDDLVIGSDGAPQFSPTSGQTYVVFGRSAGP
jgi:hypothetical protein